MIKLTTYLGHAIPRTPTGTSKPFPNCSNSPPSAVEEVQP